MMQEWLAENSFIDEEFGEGLAGDDNGNLLFDYIGQSPLNAAYGSNPAKPLADLIIDNAAWPFCGEPVPLEKVMDDLCRRGLLEWNREAYFDVAEMS